MLENYIMLNRITINPEICDGKPIIRNLRITVDFILKLIGDGYSADEIIQNYPDFLKGAITLWRENDCHCMKILADMHISPHTVAFLRSLGHDTVRVNEILPSDSSDRMPSGACRKQRSELSERSE